MDFSSTYDGVTIVSQLFKEFCKRNGYHNLVFAELPQAPGFYQFYVTGNELAYTANQHEKLCEACGQKESCVGPTMLFDKVPEPLSDGFYQSDLWFGSGNEKTPLIIVAPATKKKLDEENFRGICAHAIEKPTNLHA